MWEGPNGYSCSRAPVGPLRRTPAGDDSTAPPLRTARLGVPLLARPGPPASPPRNLFSFDILLALMPDLREQKPKECAVQLRVAGRSEGAGCPTARPQLRRRP